MRQLAIVSPRFTTYENTVLEIGGVVYTVWAPEVTVTDSVVVLHQLGSYYNQSLLSKTNAVIDSVNVVSGGYAPQRDLTNACPPERMQDAPTVANPGAPEGHWEIAACLTAS